MTVSLDYKSSFPAVVRPDTMLVILGTLPGERSLALRQYYAHPRNQFWRLLGDVLDIDLTARPYDTRLQTLLDRRIGLWDVVARAKRRGSLDADLREVRMHDMEELLRAAPGLKAVGFNGGVAWSQAAFFETRGIATVRLPSSSPAHVRPYAEKLAAWLALRPHLE